MLWKPLECFFTTIMVNLSPLQICVHVHIAGNLHYKVNIKKKKEKKRKRKNYCTSTNH